MVLHCHRCGVVQSNISTMCSWDGCVKELDLSTRLYCFTHQQSLASAITNPSSENQELRQENHYLQQSLRTKKVKIQNLKGQIRALETQLNEKEQPFQVEVNKLRQVKNKLKLKLKQWIDKVQSQKI